MQVPLLETKQMSVFLTRHVKLLLKQDRCLPELSRQDILNLRSDILNLRSDILNLRSDISESNLTFWISDLTFQKAI